MSLLALRPAGRPEASLWQTALDVFRQGTDLADDRVDLARRAELEADPERWLRAMFGKSFAHPITGAPVPFADHHRDLWSWVWSIAPDERPPAFVGIWARGGGKSTSAEIATIALGALRRRRYVLYVSRTQDQADQHIASIATLLESEAVATWYPSLGERMVNKYGTSRGWRRNRLRTAAGFTVDSLGIDTASRGVKIDNVRPDLVVFDDIDDTEDRPPMTAKVENAITRKILPTGSPAAASMFIQNLINRDGVAARIVAGTADYLSVRVLSGPVPAVRDLDVAAVDQPDGSRVITVRGGTPTWAGQDIAVVQQQIADWGFDAFKREAQHDVSQPLGSMFDSVQYREVDRDAVPPLSRVAVWVDPAVTDTDQSDAYGVSVLGLDSNKFIYVLDAYEERSSTNAAIERAIRMAWRHGARTIGLEVDQGGDAWASVYRETCQWMHSADPNHPPFPPCRIERASQHGSKEIRAAQMLADYHLGKIAHVRGPHLATVSAALGRYLVAKPFDYVDSQWWAWADLRGHLKTRREIAPPLIQARARGWFA